MKYYDKLIFELSAEGRRGFTLPVNRYPLGSCGSKNKTSDKSLSLGEDTLSFEAIPSELRRETPLELPSVSEPDAVRHYTLLSQMNFGVDTGFYPLGSCTMKYNPKINEEIASMKAFAEVHPLQPLSTVKGCTRVYEELSRSLSAITGMAAFTLNPFAGAHGELTGLMVMRQYHISRGDLGRRKVIVPDSAHGTNPASAAVCGLEVVQVKSKADGRIDVESLRPLLDESVAGIMMTNPNTLGLFESEIKEIASLVHACGGLLYYDGANMNPLIGVVRPGDMGFDIMHLNLHKSFSTPHGGGGPGSGPVGVAARLVPYLPKPCFYVQGALKEGLKSEAVAESGSETRTDLSLGRISGFQGNFTVLLKALTYILMLGKENVKAVGPLATLSANYIKESLRDSYELPIEGVCKHEFVFNGLKDKSTGVTTLDVAKRLLDYGFHAPTIYFPLLFHEAIMIEPTETESKETLDAFIDVMHRIAAEALSDPESLKSAPHTTPVRRLDETTAARSPKLRV